MVDLSLAILLGVVTFFSTLAGGVFTLKNSRLSMNYLFAFAAGALIGVSFFDILPEDIDILHDTNIPTVAVMGSIVVAFFFFHVLDRRIAFHGMKHGHGTNGNEETLQKVQLTNGMVRASGLSIHSLLDGVAIGAAFHIGAQLGAVVALAVIFHDFSDGLNTVTVMLRAGAKKRTASFWLLLDALTPIVGVLSTFIITLNQEVLAIVLAFFVGEFLFIGAADLLPEAHQRGSSMRVVLASILGVLLIFAVTRFLNL